MNFVEKVKTLQNYFKLGNFKKVIEGCKLLNKKFPNNSFVLNLSGMAYQNLLNHHKAIDFFELALKADNLNIAAMNNLANSLKVIDQFVRADKIFQQILKEDPNYINAYNNYANLKIAVNDVEGAIELYNQAIVLAKKKKIYPINFLLHLANALQSLSREKELMEVIEEILKLDPENTEAHKILSWTYKYSKTNSESMSHISIMENILKKKTLNNDQKSKLSFGLGKAYDDLKDVEQAIKFISSGNQLHKNIFKSNIIEETNIMNRMIKIFKDINLNKSPNFFSKKKIIFICGMPRSGTTLVEQIIASHKEVYGAGELLFLTNVIHDNFFNGDLIDKQRIIENQNSEKNLINEKYFEKFLLYKIKKQIITDKAPLNFKWIGFIKIFFPNSKIIHCKRNSRDNCLSIFKNYFSSPRMNWAYDQRDVSDYYNNYNSIMNFWYSKIPQFIHTVEYEKIVSDKKNEIKKLLKFCDLEWDDNCLNHHKNTKTPIRTVSIAQARQPVYSSSVNSGDNYKDYLKEMFDNLI
jgi:tetratricopeptide (TPR) repeat protein